MFLDFAFLASSRIFSQYFIYPRRLMPRDILHELEGPPNTRPPVYARAALAPHAPCSALSPPICRPCYRHTAAQPIRYAWFAIIERLIARQLKPPHISYFPICAWPLIDGPVATFRLRFIRRLLLDALLIYEFLPPHISFSSFLMMRCATHEYLRRFCHSFAIAYWFASLAQHAPCHCFDASPMLLIAHFIGFSIDGT